MIRTDRSTNPVWRLPPLAAGGLALIAGLYAGLLLLGIPLPVPRPALAEVHGPVMVRLRRLRRNPRRAGRPLPQRHRGATFAGGSSPAPVAGLPAGAAR